MTCGTCGLLSESRSGAVERAKIVLLFDSPLVKHYIFARNRCVENPGVGTPKFSDEEIVATTRLPYRSLALIEYGSVSKLTEGTGITANGDGGQHMMVTPCL